MNAREQHELVLEAIDLGEETIDELGLEGSVEVAVDYAYDESRGKVTEQEWDDMYEEICDGIGQ